MANLNHKEFQIDESTDLKASSLLLSSLDVDVLSIVVEFLDPQSMIQFTSTSRFFHEFPLAYETVIRNSVLHDCHEEISSRLARLQIGRAHV